MPDGPVLLYDGTCGFCAESVQLVLRHDRKCTLRFAPLQGALGAAVRAAHPELAGVDSVLWLEPGGGRVLVRSTAALRVARYLGGWWNVLRVAALVPAPIRDGVYRLVARHRHQLLRGGPACLVPGPEVRERFLE